MENLLRDIVKEVETIPDTYRTKKLNMLIAKANQELNKDYENFKMFASAYGFKPEDFGKKFVHAGKVYQIVELNPSRKKYPITGKSASGALYKFPATTVKLGLKEVA